MHAPILIVDDEESSRRAVRAILEAERFPVVEASSGQAAINWLVDEGSPEVRLILLDLTMPRMSGWEFLAIIRSYSRLAPIPVVVLSTNPPTHQALEHGVVEAWIQRPYDPAELLALVRANERRSSTIPIARAR